MNFRLHLELRINSISANAHVALPFIWRDHVAKSNKILLYEVFYVTVRVVTTGSLPTASTKTGSVVSTLFFRTSEDTTNLKAVVEGCPSQTPDEALDSLLYITMKVLSNFRGLENKDDFAKAYEIEGGKVSRDVVKLQMTGAMAGKLDAVIEDEPEVVPTADA